MNPRLLVGSLKSTPKCRHCGGNVNPEFDPDLGWEWKCLQCGRLHKNYRDYGRMGGLQTKLRHDSGYYAENGRKGGLASGASRRLPTIDELRHTAPEFEEEERLSNSLKRLRGLYAVKVGASSHQGGGS